MGGEHVPQHDCHGLQTCRYHKINRETLRSGSYTPPSARAASRIAFQRHLHIRKSSGRQEHSPAFLSTAKAPLYPGAAWKAAAAPVCTHEVRSQEGPAAAQGSHPNTTSTDPTSLQRADTPGAVWLVTFCLEQEALTSAETRSA